MTKRPLQFRTPEHLPPGSQLRFESDERSTPWSFQRAPRGEPSFDEPEHAPPSAADAERSMSPRAHIERRERAVSARPAGTPKESGMLPIARRSRSGEHEVPEWDHDAAEVGASVGTEPSQARARVLWQPGPGVYTPQLWEESNARAKADRPAGVTHTDAHAKAQWPEDPPRSDARVKAQWPEDPPRSDARVKAQRPEDPPRSDARVKAQWPEDPPRSDARVKAQWPEDPPRSDARVKAQWPEDPPRSDARVKTQRLEDPPHTDARAKGSRRLSAEGAPLEPPRSQPSAAQPVLAAHPRDVAAEQARLSVPPPKPVALGPLRYDSSDVLALVLGATALAGQWLLHNTLGLTAIALTPLFMMALRRWDARGAIQAGMLWVLLAWAELVHALQAGSGWLAVPPQRVAALTVLAVIVLRLHAAYRGVQELSRRDPLTGLLNRRGFEELATRELRRAERHGRPIAFALIDIDRFKQVNDRYGHAVGDRVLQLVAAQLSALRVSDFAVRLGGDEFGLLMPETDQAGAQQLLSRLDQAVHERLRAHRWPVTLSVGVADNRLACRAGLMDALFAEADRRMYVAKARVHQAQRRG